MSTVDRVADQSGRDLANRSATGEVQSAAEWLDDHFEACREPYTRILEAAALPEGGTVLDVGSGTGSFLPLIRDQIGAAGRLVAMDHDTENTRIVVLSVNGPQGAVTIGLRADRVFEVTVLDSDTLDPAPSISASWSGHCIEGIGRRNGRFVTVLDLDRLLGDVAALGAAA